MTADNPRQQARIKTLQLLIKEKQDELRVTIALRRAGKTSAALKVLLNGSGKQIMDQIRAVIQATEELSLLDRRNQDQESAARRLILMMSGGAAVLLILLLAGLREINRSVIARVSAEDAERNQRQRLQVALDSIGDCVIAVDHDGRVTTINPVAADWRQS